MRSIVDTYRSRTPRSAAMHERAVRALPGGDTRAVVSHRPYPLTMARAEGPYLWDVDGNRYLDLLGNYTSLVHGNAYPPIIAAAEEALRRGTQWAARNEPAVALAETLCRRVGSVERVRFTNSGSEATLLAVEIARAATGRRKILMARFGYHGSGAIFETGTHGREGPDTLLARYGDADDFAAVLERHGDVIACVILEPVLGAGGVMTPPPGFLQSVANAARGAGSVFVLDEVITLRLGVGGAQAGAGVAPDLTTMAKIIGGGFPVGAVGGSEALMALTRPDGGPVPSSGTFNGNPVTAAAGLVSVEHLTEDRIAAMARATEVLAGRCAAATEDNGLPGAVTTAGSLLNLYLADTPAVGPSRPDAAAIGLLHLACLNHGVFLAPRGMMALSTVLESHHIDEAAAGIAAALGDVAASLHGATASSLAR